MIQHSARECTSLAMVLLLSQNRTQFVKPKHLLGFANMQGFLFDQFLALCSFSAWAVRFGIDRPKNLQLYQLGF
jgi:hypothetical protein